MLQVIKIQGVDDDEYGALEFEESDMSLDDMIKLLDESGEEYVEFEITNRRGSKELISAKRFTFKDSTVCFWFECFIRDEIQGYDSSKDTQFYFINGEVNEDN